ncbi:MAG: ergothioneine biosynthesis protein EgtB [Betaproteobacteria bacterium]|nr:ergothioneine biosynthesis protein EgtB [Betaproteobacteria bacterium]
MAVTKVPVCADELARALRAQRQYTLALYADLPEPLWTPAQVPCLQRINPPLWELAHIAWFAEYFALRNPRYLTDGAWPDSRLSGADQLFDSRFVAHASRWQLSYPSRSQCLQYMQQVLDDLIAALKAPQPPSLYEFQLALLHEDMHAEALAMTLRTLGLPFPAAVPVRRNLTGNTADIRFQGGDFQLGGGTGRPFRFDNEKPSHPVVVESFAIASDPVSAADFARFCGSASYRNRQYWSDAGWQWLQEAGQTGEQECSANQPAMHCNYYQAEAYCRSVGRRLPTEAEWEFAATRSAEFATSTGMVWEWTASAFAPFPGFRPDVYRDYSEPWFHTHQVLRGGSFVTHPRLRYPQYRNFYTPERSDMFCGFRTCAVD